MVANKLHNKSTMEIPRHWRLKKQRYSLVGERCITCGKPDTFIFPPREVHPKEGFYNKDESKNGIAVELPTKVKLQQEQD